MQRKEIFRRRLKVRMAYDFRAAKKKLLYLKKKKRIIIYYQNESYRLCLTLLMFSESDLLNGNSNQIANSTVTDTECIFIYLFFNHG